MHLKRGQERKVIHANQHLKLPKAEPIKQTQMLNHRWYHSRLTTQNLRELIPEAELILLSDRQNRSDESQYGYQAAGRKPNMDSG